MIRPSAPGVQLIGADGPRAMRKGRNLRLKSRPDAEFLTFQRHMQGIPPRGCHEIRPLCYGFAQKCGALACPR